MNTEESQNPKGRPCKACVHFQVEDYGRPDRRWCDAIQDTVKPWRTGCIRHTLKDNPADFP